MSYGDGAIKINLNRLNRYIGKQVMQKYVSTHLSLSALFCILMLQLTNPAIK